VVKAATATSARAWTTRSPFCEACPLHRRGVRVGPSRLRFTTLFVEPLATRDYALHGVVLVPSLRCWPNVSSTLDDEALSYAKARTGRTEVHEAATQGFPRNGGLIGNVSMGYTCVVGQRRRRARSVCGRCASRTADPCGAVYR
jgi:hypothetical protein